VCVFLIVICYVFCIGRFSTQVPPKQKPYTIEDLNSTAAYFGRIESLVAEDGTDHIDVTLIYLSLLDIAIMKLLSNYPQTCFRASFVFKHLYEKYSEIAVAVALDHLALQGLVWVETHPGNRVLYGGKFQS